MKMFSFLLITIFAVNSVAAPAPVYKPKLKTDMELIADRNYQVTEYNVGYTSTYTYTFKKNQEFKLGLAGCEGDWYYKDGMLTMHEVVASNPIVWRIYSFKFDLKTMKGEGFISNSYNWEELNKKVSIEVGK